MDGQIGDTIGVDAVVRELGITSRTLRYYEEIGLLTPVARTPGGHRLYDQSAIERLKNVIRLKENLGFSLQEIRNVMEAEQELEALRKNFRESKAAGDEEDKRHALDSYIRILEDLVATMDSKIQSLTSMRQAYQERLERSIRFRSEKFKTEES